MCGAAVTGGCNIALGFRAAHELTSGQGNMIFGKYAGEKLDDVQHNLFMGTYTGRGMCEGAYNIFLGYNAGCCSGTGGCEMNSSVLIGNNAGKQTCNGNQTIFIGSSAGTNVLEAVNSIHIGCHAGCGTASCSGGSGNIFIGKSSAAKIYTGTNNVMVGNLVGCEITTGNGNVIIGQESAVKISTGSCNVYLGKQAGPTQCTSTASHNFMYGYETGRYHDSGDDNILIGQKVNGGTTAGGGNNVMIGCKTGFCNASTNNFFVGTYAAYCTNGSNDVIIGCKAGRFYQDGSENIFIGRYAGADAECSKCAVCDNIIIGGYAGYANGTCMTGENSDHNIFMGCSAGRYKREGSYNVAFGYHAGKQSSTQCCGQCNISIGYRAGASGVQYGNTVAIGSDAGCCLTDGCYHILIGKGAGTYLTGGDRSIVIGERAGSDGSGCLTSANSVILIGTQINPPHGGTSNSQLQIGAGTSFWIKGDSSYNVEFNTVTKAGGSFKIDHPHPTKTATHHLVHSFIEGPQQDLIYRGRATLVNGVATINIDTSAGMTDGTFVLLNRDIQSFTTNETGWDAVKSSVSGNVLTITSQDNTSTATISWMVIGERQDDTAKKLGITDDDGYLIVEPPKEVVVNESAFAGTDTTFTTRDPHGYVVNDTFKALDADSAQVGATFTVKEVPNTTTIVATTTSDLGVISQLKLTS